MEKMQEIMEAIRELGPDGLQALQEVVKLEEMRAAKDDTPPHLHGTPRDTAVQKLASFALRLLRSPIYRAEAFRTLGSEKLSYEMIGDKFGGGVSRERIRGLHERLNPHLYEEEKVERAS